VLTAQPLQLDRANRHTFKRLVFFLTISLLYYSLLSLVISTINGYHKSFAIIDLDKRYLFFVNSYS